MPNWRWSQSKATAKVRKAIESGELVRPDSCEICSITPHPSAPRENRKKRPQPAIVAHHWNGYENPLDIWWLCQSCNKIITGEKFHNGTMTKEQVRRYIKEVHGSKEYQARLKYRLR